MKQRHPPRLEFVAIEELDGRPHVVCDGAPRPGTVLTLSHWPATPTPRPLQGDLSCEIVFSYLRGHRYWRHDAIGATNDHFDEDGLAGLFALAEPSRASELAGRLVDFARAGDFGVAATPGASRAVFAVHAIAVRDGFKASGHAGSVAERGATELYRELLACLPELLEHPERFPIDSAEQEALDASRAAISSRKITIEHDEGLAFVTVPEQFHAPSSLPLLSEVKLPVHHFALHEASSAVRMLVSHGGRYIYYDRYETWVRFVSRRLPKRRDLVLLAERLSEAEARGSSWRADMPGTVVAGLWSDDSRTSNLSPGKVRSSIGSYLRGAPVAWDPFDATAPLVVGRRS